ncbi:MAG: universal stress protein [Salinivirgaceae bacterium]
MTTINILVPIDFSDKSKEGLFQAIQIANRTRAKIFLLHIVKEHMPPWSLLTDDDKTSQTDIIKKTLLKEAEQFMGDSSVELEPIVTFGKLCEQILKQADELEASMIVMGTSTADNIKKKIIGGNALRIVTEAKIPVITVKLGCASKNPANIILPLDLSKETREKVSDAIYWAKKLECRIYAVSFTTTRDDAIVGHLKGQLRQVESFVEKAGVEVETDFRFYHKGSRQEKLVEFIQEKEGDLVIITTHQQPEIVKFFLGSFAEDMIHSAPIPVMTKVPKGTFKTVSTMPGSF